MSRQTISDLFYYKLYQYGIISQVDCQQCKQQHKQQTIDLQHYYNTNTRVPSKRDNNVNPVPLHCTQQLHCTHNNEGCYRYTHNEEIADAYINENNNNKPNPQFLQQVTKLIHKIQLHDTVSQHTVESLFHCIQLNQCNITQIDNSIIVFKHLQVLDLSHNNITTIPSCITDLSELTELNLSHNQIIDITQLQATKLNKLDLSYNKIETLTSLPSTLTEINLSYNNLSNIQATLTTLQPLHNLTTLSLQYNPVSLHKLYKYVVSAKLPQVTCFDNVPAQTLPDEQLAILLQSHEPVDPKSKPKAGDKKSAGTTAKLNKKQQEKLEEQARLLEQQQIELLNKRRTTWQSYIQSHTVLNEPIAITIELNNLTQLPAPLQNDVTATKPNKASKSKQTVLPTEHTVVTAVGNVKTTVTTKSLFYIQYILHDINTVYETPQLLYTDVLNYSTQYKTTIPSATLRTILLLTGITFILKRCNTVTTVVETSAPVVNNDVLPVPVDTKSKRKSGTKPVTPVIPLNVTTVSKTEQIVDVLGTYMFDTVTLINQVSSDNAVITQVDVKQAITFTSSDNTVLSTPQCDLHFVLNDSHIPTLEQLRVSETTYEQAATDMNTHKLQTTQISIPTQITG